MNLKNFLLAVVNKKYPPEFDHTRGLCANVCHMLNSRDEQLWEELHDNVPAYFIQPRWLYDLDKHKYRGYYGWKRRQYCKKLLKELYNVL